MGAIQQVLAALGGAGGGGDEHRYWRLRDFTGSSAYFETSEIELRESGVAVSGGVVPVASTSPGGNAINNMTDGILNVNQMFWTTAVADTLTLEFDLTVPAAVDAVRICRYDTTGRLPTACTLDHSDDGSSWTEVGSGAVSDPGTNFTFTSEITFA